MVAEDLAGGLHGRPARLQARVDPDLAVADLLEAVQAQVAHPRRVGVGGQVVGRAPGDQRHGGEASGQRAEQLDHALQRPGRLRVGDDWAEGAVEVQAEGDLVRPRRQPDGPLGQDSPGAGHGRRSRGNSCSAPGASSTVWSRTRTLMGGAGPGRDLTSRWSSASSTSTRWPR